MTEYQLIILRTIVERVKDKSQMNGSRGCFEQFGPLDLPMELSEFLELDKIKTYLDDILADIPNMVN
jgi:hypothetical protein